MPETIFDFVAEVLENVPIGLFFFIILFLVLILLITSKNMVAKMWKSMPFGYKLLFIASIILIISIIITI